ncbi:MAG: dehydratase [Hyphomicrobiaceae bacterium]|nr:dehydratase [Hyphomicrobiaceae bacterium]
MAEKTYFEGYEIGAVRETGGRTITETDIVVHAGHTGDFFPHHLDEEFARKGPFGRRIAHGTMLVAIGIGLTAGRVNEAAFAYGYDKVRFIRPVFIGDTIRTRVTVLEKVIDAKNPRRGRVTERCEILNQRSEIVVLVDQILMVERRPDAQ